jgi:hypothetical protein
MTVRLRNMTLRPTLEKAGLRERTCWILPRQRGALAGQACSTDSVKRYGITRGTADGQASVVQRGTVTRQSSNPWGSFSQLWRQENTYDSRGNLNQDSVVGGGSPVAVTQYRF